MRKPKLHPTFGTDLVGTQFGVRWNVVQMATEAELNAFIDNYKKIKENNRDRHNQSYWEWKLRTANEAAQNTHFKKLWRKRHSQTFKENVLYKSQREFRRWDTKLSPVSGEGASPLYHFDKEREYKISSGDILVLTKTDELGNLYFSKIDSIDAKHSFVFTGTSVFLSYILPVEE